MFGKENIFPRRRGVKSRFPLLSLFQSESLGPFLFNDCNVLSGVMTCAPMTYRGRVGGGGYVPKATSGSLGSLLSSDMDRSEVGDLMQLDVI